MWRSGKKAEARSPPPPSRAGIRAPAPRECAEAARGAGDAPSPLACLLFCSDAPASRPPAPERPVRSHTGRLSGQAHGASAPSRLPAAACPNPHPQPCPAGPRPSEQRQLSGAMKSAGGEPDLPRGNLNAGRSAEQDLRVFPPGPRRRPGGSCS